MTDVNEAPVEATEAVEEKPKGRPRPQATVDLDAKVLTAITNAGDEGVTKEALAVTVEQPENKVYLALYRLRTTNQVHRVRSGRTTVWKVGVKSEEAAVPAEAPSEA